MRKPWIIFAPIIAGMLIFTACGGAASGNQSSDGAANQTTRPEPPEQYANLENSYDGEEAAEAEGESLYQADCSSCHGPFGRGDGPAAGGLDPKPQNLAANQSQLSDGYLFWRISEGGLIDPFYSVMPAWRGILNEEQIWQIITFLRTLEG